VDGAATVLSQLIGIELVPPAGRVAICNWLASTFYRLTSNTRQTVTEALVGAATVDKATVAYPAGSALIKLADLQMLSLPPFASDARHRKLVENYRAYLAQNHPQQASPEFELRLGLR
jgi:hypothetical protein